MKPDDTGPDLPPDRRALNVSGPGASGTYSSRECLVTATSAPLSVTSLFGLNFRNLDIRFRLHRRPWPDLRPLPEALAEGGTVLAVVRSKLKSSPIVSSLRRTNSSAATNVLLTAERATRSRSSTSLGAWAGSLPAASAPRGRPTAVACASRRPQYGTAPGSPAGRPPRSRLPAHPLRARTRLGRLP